MSHMKKQGTEINNIIKALSKMIFQYFEEKQEEQEDIIKSIIS